MVAAAATATPADPPENKHMNRIGLIVASALLALMVLASTLFVVDQRQLAVVYALGEIKEVIN
ncbi:MAG: hypothetical protein CFE45_08785, partial [Burkholderiales bacterium PBB5]